MRVSKHPVVSEPAHIAIVSFVDACKRGLWERDLVKISNGEVECLATVCISAEVTEGTIRLSGAEEFEKACVSSKLGHTNALDAIKLEFESLQATAKGFVRYCNVRIEATQPFPSHISTHAFSR